MSSGYLEHIAQESLFLLSIWKIINSNYEVVEDQYCFNLFNYCQAIANKTKYILMILSSTHLQQLISQAQKNKHFKIFSQEVLFDSDLKLVHIEPLVKVNIGESLFNNGAVFLLKKGGDAELVKKGGAFTNTLNMDSFDRYYKQRNLKDPVQASIETILLKMKQAKPIQIYETYYPHGYEIEAKYSQISTCWILSLFNQCIAFRTKQQVAELCSHKNSILSQIASLFIDRYGDNEQIKKIFDQYSLKGIVNYSINQITWMQIQLLNIQQSQQIENLHVVRAKLQKLGLKFIKINKLGTVVNQDQLHRLTEDSSRKGYILPYQMRTDQYGRRRVGFYCQYSKLLEFNILTFQDELWNKFKQMISIESDDDLLTRVAKLKQFYLQHSIKLNTSSYPWLYYQQLFNKVFMLLQISQNKDQLIRFHFQFILKLALYMSLKRVSIQKYGRMYINSKNIRKQLSLLSFNNLGPVGCKRINFFTFFSVGKGKQKLIDLMRQRFSLINQPFIVLKQTPISSQDFIKDLTINSIHVIRNYFLQAPPEKDQWEQFSHLFKQQKIENTYCQLIIVSQPPFSFYRINNQIYPISLQTISNAYLQAYNLRKKQPLLKNKIVELDKVTKQLKSLQTHGHDSTVQIAWHEYKEIRQVEQGIRIILSDQSNQDKSYYLLISRIQKYKQHFCPTWNLTQQHVSQILSHLYFNIPALIPENLL